MFDVVVNCAGPQINLSSEFRFGLLRLRQQVGAHSLWLEPPVSESTLGGGRLQYVLDAARSMDDTALLLWLAHPQVHIPDVSMQRLGVEVKAGTKFALCWTNLQPPDEAPLDYCTAQGIERYAQATVRNAAGQGLALTRETLARSCQVGATTLGALRALEAGQTLQAARMPGCFAHDFSNYHQGQREEVLAWIPQGVRRILDVGGGEGQFLELVRQHRGCETHLSEYSPVACAAAAPRVDHAWPGDYLALAPTSLPSKGVGAFDCITFLDSLEHAAEPGQWLDKAYLLLTDQGCIVGSVPNVGHWSVVADLLEGRWDYCPVGIHCNTHLRFFTRKTLADLLQRHGFEVEATDVARVPGPSEWQQHWLATPGLQTAGAELDAYAFIFRARKRLAL